MKSDLLTAVVGILIIATIMSYVGFIFSAKMHFEAASKRNEALDQLETLAFMRELKENHQ